MSSGDPRRLGDFAVIAYYHPLAEIEVLQGEGMGYSEEYHVSRYFRESRLMKIAPVSQEMILNFLGEHVLVEWVAG